LLDGNTSAALDGAGSNNSNGRKGMRRVMFIVSVGWIVFICLYTF
jgi:hypothetical protein